MPNITIEGPKIEDMDVKRILVREITDSLEKAYKIPREHIVISIKHLSPEDVSVGGILIADRRKGPNP